MNKNIKIIVAITSLITFIVALINVITTRKVKEELSDYCVYNHYFDDDYFDDDDFE